MQNPGVSPECIDMLKRILVADPRQRLGMDEIKQHAWFTRGLPPGALEMNEFLLQGLGTMDDVRKPPLPLANANKQHCCLASRVASWHIKQPMVLTTKDATHVACSCLCWGCRHVNSTHVTPATMHPDS